MSTRECPGALVIAAMTQLSVVHAARHGLVRRRVWPLQLELKQQHEIKTSGCAAAHSLRKADAPERARAALRTDRKYSA